MFSEKKQQKTDYEKAGLCVGEIHDTKKTSPLLMCLLRATIIFMACYSSVIGFSEAFNLPYNKASVTLFILAISIYMAFLYLNKLLFYAGYIVLLGGFTLELIRYYLYANSGFQAIINIVRKAYSDHFDLNIMRESEEFYADRYTTITITLFFLIVFIALLLNVTVSRYMNLPETVLVTFLVLEFPLYIGLKPPLYTIVMLLACYICVGVLQTGAHTKIIIKSRHSHEYIRFRWRNRRYYTYQGNAVGFFMILGCSVLLSATICLFSVAIYNSPLGETEPGSAKEAFDDNLKIIVQNGFSGLFDRYNSTNGIASGQLGGVSSISPDFETDLIVTLVPDGNDTVYLRSFTGYDYRSTSWEGPRMLGSEDNADDKAYVSNPEGEALSSDAVNSDVDGAPHSAVYDSDFNTELTFNRLEAEEQKDFRTAYDASPVRTKIRIENTDNMIVGYLRPYRTLYENVSISQTYTDDDGTLHETIDRTVRDVPVMAVGSVLTAEYAPIKNTEFPNPIGSKRNASSVYYRHVYEDCRTVPSSLDNYLKQFLKKNDYLGVDLSRENYSKYAGNLSPDSLSNSFRLDVCEHIRDYFYANYPYTLSPGTTPRSSDFVRYFLETQKRGFCVHFASAATLLLREFGIPARYCEGYVVPSSLIRESGTTVNGNIFEWYSGPESPDSHEIVSVEVSDYYAHAWVEVYLEGYGFVPFEFTPPSFEKMPEPSSPSAIADFFSRLMNVDLGLSLSGNDDSRSDTYNQDSSVEVPDVAVSDFSAETVLKPVFILIVATALFFAAYLLLKHIRKKLLMKDYLNKGDFTKLIHINYVDFAAFLRRKHIADCANPLPMETAELLCNRIVNTDSAVSSEEILSVFSFIEQALYGRNNIYRDEYDNFSVRLSALKKAIKAGK